MKHSKSLRKSPLFPIIPIVPLALFAASWTAIATLFRKVKRLEIREGLRPAT